MNKTIIKNGHPQTIGTGCPPDNMLFSELSEQAQKLFMEWVETRLIPRKTAYTSIGSYNLKHLLQHDTGVYTSHNQFKDGMMQAGYEPRNMNEYYWHFGISSKSPVFHEFLPRAEYVE